MWSHLWVTLSSTKHSRDFFMLFIYLFTIESNFVRTVFLWRNLFGPCCPDDLPFNLQYWFQIQHCKVDDKVPLPVNMHLLLWHELTVILYRCGRGQLDFLAGALMNEAATAEPHLLNSDCLHRKKKLTLLIIFRTVESCCCFGLFDLSGETSIKHNGLHFYFVNYKTVNKKMQDNLYCS